MFSQKGCMKKIKDGLLKGRTKETWEEEEEEEQEEQEEEEEEENNNK